MKRLLTLAGITAAVVFPASGSAATFKHYLGTVHGGGTMGFTLKRFHNGHRKVLHFRWADVPVKCQQPDPPGHELSTYTFSHSLRIKRGQFRDLDVAGPGAALHVTGHLSHRSRRAVGTIRILGDISEGNGCTTGGNVTWHGHQVPG
jgi:hypothetical protein